MENILASYKKLSSTINSLKKVKESSTATRHCLAKILADMEEIKTSVLKAAEIITENQVRQLTTNPNQFVLCRNPACGSFKIFQGQKCTFRESYSLNSEGVCTLCGWSKIRCEDSDPNNNDPNDRNPRLLKIQSEDNDTLHRMETHNTKPNYFCCKLM